MYQLVFSAFKNINKWIAIDSHHNFMPISIFVKSYVGTRSNSSCYILRDLSSKSVSNVFVHQCPMQPSATLHCMLSFFFSKTGEARRDNLPAAAILNISLNVLLYVHKY